MFPTIKKCEKKLDEERKKSRNPLKSGQCFLLSAVHCAARVGLSVLCRNPLKSGQCFLPNRKPAWGMAFTAGRNPLKSGQCFLRADI